MILDTFTHHEMFTTLRAAYKTLTDRAAAYLSHNSKEIYFLCNNGKYERIISGVINRQRYTLGTEYQRISKGHIIFGCNTLYTVFYHGNSQMLVKMYPYGPEDNPRYGIGYFTEHYMNRFCERLNLCDSNTPLLDKARLFDNNTDLRIHGSFEDNIINRFYEPSLEAPFLPKENRRTKCECLKNGDISIVEYYDNIAVYRTYITKDMLFKNQLNDTSYINCVKKSIADQDTLDDHNWIPKHLLGF